MNADDFEARQGVVPIQIRPYVTVRVGRIPHDLTTAEAEKIGRVVLALASVDRSGEAGETRSEAEGLDPKGESAVAAKQRDAHPTSSGDL